MQRFILRNRSNRTFMELKHQCAVQYHLKFFQF